MLAEEKQCLSCKQRIIGRTDKKFCDDYCRSAFNNKKHRAEKNLIRRVNHLLLKNRRILKSCLGDGNEPVTTMRHHLSSRGFQFNYFTHTLIANDGRKFICCYDHAYLASAQEAILVVCLSEKTEQFFIPYTEYEQV